MDLGGGTEAKLKDCQNMVMLHIKFKLTTYAVTWHTLDPVGGVKISNNVFYESSHVTYQIKGNRAQSPMKANMLALHTPTTPGTGFKRSYLFSLLKVVMLHIKLKWKKCMQGNTLNVHTWGWVERSDIKFVQT